MFLSRLLDGLIPVYTASGKLVECATSARFAELEERGLLREVIRHPKGRIARGILRRRLNDYSVGSAGMLCGAKYTYRERLQGGRRVHSHKQLNYFKGRKVATA